MDFEWDAGKARANLEKHGVSFEEALSVFLNPLSITIPDPQHSTLEDRFVMMGRSREGRTLVVVHAEREGRVRLISARRATPREIREYERGEDQVKEKMLPEYDFSGGVRGKYAKRFAKDCYVVVLEPDVARIFHSSREVNAALRAVVRVTRGARSRGKRLAS